DASRTDLASLVRFGQVPGPGPIASPNGTRLAFCPSAACRAGSGRWSRSDTSGGLAPAIAQSGRFLRPSGRDGSGHGADTSPGRPGLRSEPAPAEDAPEVPDQP